MIILSLLPIFYAVLLLHKRKTMTVEATKVKFGSLFQGIRHLSVWQSFYSVIFLLRRMAFVLILVFLDERPFLVVALILESNLAFVCYIGYTDPHNQPSLRNLEILNEMLMQIVTYHLVVTWFSTSPGFEMNVGWSLIFSIAFFYSFNLSYILG